MHALITGASSGIGLELARIHAQHGGHMVLVARSRDKLQQLADELHAQYGVTVIPIAQDLAQPGAAQAVFAETERLGITIDILINNAGRGGHGRFVEHDLADDMRMIQLNITALSEFTHLYLQGMVQRRRGKILNISSTASFLPGPWQAVYYATKAYVSSFSQAVAEEVREYGITVTALCPGPVATGFAQASHSQGLALWKHAPSAQSVAECGYQAMQQGKLLVFHERKYRLAIDCLLPLTPRKTVLKISRMLMQKH